MTTNAWISSGKFSAYGTDKIVASLFFNMELLVVKLEKNLKNLLKLIFKYYHFIVFKSFIIT